MIIEVETSLLSLAGGLISGGVLTYLLRVYLPELDSKTKKWDCIFQKYSELHEKCENRLKNMEDKMEKIELKLNECEKNKKRKIK